MQFAQKVPASAGEGKPALSHLAPGLSACDDRAMAIVLTILLWLYVAAAVAYWAVAAWAMWRMGSSIARLARAGTPGPLSWACAAGESSGAAPSTPPTPCGRAGE